MSAFFSLKSLFRQFPDGHLTRFNSSFTAPANGQLVNQSVTLSAKAKTTKAGTVWVRFCLDPKNAGQCAVNKSTLLGDSSSSITWDSSGVTPGTHKLQVDGYVSSGSTTTHLATMKISVVVASMGCVSAETCAKYPISDAEAAAMVVAAAESQSENAKANKAEPTKAELAQLQPLTGLQNADGQRLMKLVTGKYRGTTPEIIQWAAFKWGFDPVRYYAEAYNESYWNMSEVGDIGNGVSLSMIQIKSADYTGTCPNATGVTSTSCAANPILCSPTCLSHNNSAFAMDYALAIQHACIVGDNTYLAGGGYVTGPGVYNDPWGCMGAWFSGSWEDSGSLNYQSIVKGYFNCQPWLGSGFGNGNPGSLLGCM